MALRFRFELAVWGGLWHCTLASWALFATTRISVRREPGISDETERPLQSLPLLTRSTHRPELAAGGDCSLAGRAMVAEFVTNPRRQSLRRSILGQRRARGLSVTCSPARRPHTVYCRVYHLGALGDRGRPSTLVSLGSCPGMGAFPVDARPNVGHRERPSVAVYSHACLPTARGNAEVLTN